MRDQLVNLARIAAIDEAARELDAELTEIPATLAEMRADVERLETLLKAEQNELAEAEALRKAQSEDLQERNDALARAKAKGAKARTPKEAEAAEREVETNRRMIKDREDEVLRLEEALEKVRESVGQHEKEFAEFRSLFEAEQEKGRARVEELEAEREKVVVGRGDVSAQLERTTLSRYERIRQQRGSGVAIVDGTTCSGCQINFQTQVFIELQRGEQLINCHGCQRFLVFREYAQT